ncbi:hypothetical protein SAMN05216296_1469 [Pseudomonas pohangensis]|uniref:Uncharacterized protein n=1 Tax=Pseudomonas pohangensis TaxID=364197 RepID=A0A1H2FBJ7_9PSED|nr:hypothetical protein [Pseudomonas pohangensis]SDU04712.1 hypothetical protein SAMN05216296_1469 [Pseudomonas pohangensis]
MKKATHSEEQSSQSHGNNTTDTSNPPSKIARVLGHLLNGKTLNRFEAERIGDHCLNSTISTLANSYGLTFSRTPEKVPNRWGIPCDVIRYGLPESERRRAYIVLLMLNKRTTRRKQGATTND